MKTCLKTLGFAFLSYWLIQSSNGASNDHGTNTLNRLLESKSLILTSSPSNQFSFVFQSALADPSSAESSYAPTVFRVAVDRTNAVIIAETTNGVPFWIMNRELFLSLDPANPGNLAYYEGGTVFWTSPSRRSYFDFSYLGVPELTNAQANELTKDIRQQVRLPAQVGLNLGLILQSLLDKTTNAQFNATSGSWQLLLNNGSTVKVTPEGDNPWFGIQTLSLRLKNGDTLAVHDIRPNVGPLQPLLTLSKPNVERAGLSIKSIPFKHIPNFVGMIPVGYPRAGAETQTAERLQSFLSLCVAQSNKTNPAKVPDLETTKTRAEQGDPRSQYNLGVIYSNGNGLQQDYNAAANWFRKAAEQGHARAQWSLGSLYAQGKGMPKDGNAALSWFRKAAEAGNSEAAFSIGEMYWLGNAFTQDKEEAVKWIAKAADLDLPLACNFLGILYLRGIGLPADTNKACLLFQKAADKGSPWAEMMIGRTLNEGIGREKNATNAVQWFRKAAEQGEPTAQLQLGWDYENGFGGLPTNAIEALKLYRLAGDQGLVYAQRYLGTVYMVGKITPPDPTEAYKWTGLAAAKGDQGAVENLRLLSEKLSKEELAEGKRRIDEFVPHPVEIADDPTRQYRFR